MQQPEPDLKDWTWVTTSRCPQCGFDPVGIERAEIPDLTRDYASVLADVTRSEGADVRPAPGIWSPLEYACHVRDVCSIFVARLHRMLTEDDPLFANWDQDETALRDEYWTQRPGLVAGQLTAVADTIAESFATVPDPDWSRPGQRCDGSTFTVESFATYFLHDLAHHVWDVTAGHPVGTLARPAPDATQ